MITVRVDTTSLDSFTFALASRLGRRTSAFIGKTVQQDASQNVRTAKDERFGRLVRWRGNLENVKYEDMGDGRVRVFQDLPYAYLFEQAVQGRIVVVDDEITEWARDKKVKVGPVGSNLKTDYSKKGTATNFMSKAAARITPSVAEVIVANEIKDIEGGV